MDGNTRNQRKARRTNKPLIPPIRLSIFAHPRFNFSTLTRYGGEVEDRTSLQLTLSRLDTWCGMLPVEL